MQLQDFIKAATSLITSTLIPVAFALCLLYFFWGVVKYIRSAGGEKDEGKKVMIWGIVGLFVAFTIWGIVRFIQSELNISPIKNIPIPQGTSVDSRVIY